MRVLNSQTTGASFVVALALSAATPASADTFTVTGATDAVNNEFASLREAFNAANGAGFADAPHQISVVSDSYDPSNGDVFDASDCNAQSPLPVLFVPIELSSTAGAVSTAGIPALTSRDSLTIEGLTIVGAQNWDISAFGGQSSRCDGSSIVVGGGELTMIDSILVGEEDGNSSPAIRLIDSSATLANVELSGFVSGIYAYRDVSDDILTLDIADSIINHGGFEGQSGEGIYTYAYNSGSLTNTAVSGWLGGGSNLDLGDWVITGGSFAENRYGLEASGANLDIVGTTFEDNGQQAIIAESQSSQFGSGSNVMIAGATFTNNGLEDDSIAGAISYENAFGPGSLVISDTSFVNNSGESYRASPFGSVEGGAGAIYAVGRVDISNVTASNTSGRQPRFGGFLRLIGDGSIVDSTFTDLQAHSGGAIHHSSKANSGFERDAYLDIINTTFEGMTAGYGGVIHTLDNATTTITGVTATDVLAETSGGFAHLNAAQESYVLNDCFPFGCNEEQAVAEGSSSERVGTSDQLRGSRPGNLIISDLTVTDAMATSGGVFGASYDGNTILGEDIVVTNARAQTLLNEPQRRGEPVQQFTSGSGGFLALNDGSYVDISNLSVTNASAADFGGLIFSGPTEIQSDFFEPSGFSTQCTPPYLDLLSFGRGAARVGNTIRIHGVVAGDLEAGQDGGIALFSDSDVVEIHAGEFSAITTGNNNQSPAFRGELDPGLNSGHIVTQNVSSFDMTCTEICDDSPVGAAVQHYESPLFSSNGARRPILRHENNVFSGIAASNAVVNLDVCDAVVEQNGRDTFGDTFGDSGFQSRVAVSAEGTGADTARDTDWFDTFGPDTGVTGVGPRGRFSVEFTTFADSAESVAIGGVGENMPVRVAHTVFSNVDLALELFDTSFIAGGYNLYSGVATVPQGDAAPVFPAPTDITDTVSFTDPAGECGDLAMWLEDGSPGQDAGNPDILDWWNDSTADMGAYGGQNACFPDEDQDGFIVVLDCNDLDLEVRPGANETPYDEIDQDCDGADLCDVDLDGFLSDALSCGGDDCDDARADINPAADEIWYDGVDQDCSGNDCDQDGDGYTADSEECGGVDCDDEDAAIYPGAPETDNDSIDSDCNGEDNVPPSCDIDGDSVISDSEECGGIDCNDEDATIYPGAPEIEGDGIDSDCNGEDNVPPGCDIDGDGVISDSDECGGIDCNDEDATIYPGAPEIEGDGIDSDCNGEDDPPVLADDRCDQDGDGVLSDSVDCEGIDCDDTDATIYPGAEDIPYDGIDQDCSGEDNCDADFDGFASVDGDCGGDDCDDTDATVYPGAGEIPDDGIDQDCDSEDGLLFVQGGPAGCDCSTTGGSAPVGLLWLGALALVGVRRRRS
ncbi:MAG: MYXO-CTERM domain-containing protein [Myxococcota bacterium]|jgi:MYXO-CTERM domain-containing protein